MADEKRPEDKPIHISAEDARAGEILVRSRRGRTVLAAGVVGIIVLVFLLRYFA